MQALTQPNILRPLLRGLQYALGGAMTVAILSLGITQEAPVGRLTGKLLMEENGKPLAGAYINLRPLEQGNEDVRSRDVQTRKDGTFRINTLPSGEYWMSLSAKNHSVERSLVNIKEGQTTTVNLSATPSDPYLDLYASQHVFTPREVPKVELHGFVQSKSVEISVYKLDVNQVAATGGLRETLSSYASPDSEKQKNLAKIGSKQEDLSHFITKRDGEGAFVESLGIGMLPEGYYFVTCTADGKEAHVNLCVSHLSLVTKTYKERSLCFASDLYSGEPLAGVEILEEGTNGLQKVGITGKDGLAEVDDPHVRQNSEGRPVKGVIIGRQGSAVAIVGIGGYSENASKVKIFGYCERPAYRPGDEVNFKGIVRRVSKEGYRLPGVGTASIEVDDPDGNKIAEMKSAVSAHGSFFGSFKTSSEAKPGSYTIHCKAFGGESTDMGANVVAYRKPEYSIEVTPDQDSYIMGSRASATVECHYYYGGPVVGATVKAMVSRGPIFSRGNSDDDEDYGSAGYGAGGEYYQEITAVTDSSGRAHITFDTKVENDPADFAYDMSYNVSVSVSEDEGKSFQGEGSVEVDRGDYDVEAEVQDPIVSPGQSVDLVIETIDRHGANKPVPNRRVTVQVGSETWQDEKSTFRPRASYEAVTGPDGKIHLSVPVIKAEPMDFRISSIDDHGHAIRTEAYAYVEGSPGDEEAVKGTIKLTLDHKHYSPGETARVMVETDLPGGSALVCVQAEGIFWKQVIPVTSTSTILQIPVVKDEAPNAYVSVTYVREKHFLEADRQLRVGRTDRDLHVSVKPDREVYLPGETAHVTVSTVDDTGHPVAADVSVGIVDEGVYSIAQDETNIKDGFYPRRTDQVRTNYSFPEIYLDGGDKGSSKVPLRTRFRDTAFWTPTVWTGPTGSTTIAVPLPDNLTEWRITAVGITDSSLVGMSTSAFRARKPLMARLSLPQFMVEGDSQRMTVVVANDTGKDQDVNIALEAVGVTLDSKAVRKIHVQNGTPQVVDYTMVAGRAGTATLSARVWVNNGPNDGVRQTFSIETKGRKLEAFAAGEGTADLNLPILATADPQYGSLEIQLSPTLAGGLVASLDDLIGFPYGCVEQTMSRFMPSILVGNAVKKLNLPEPSHLKDLPKIVQDSLVRLDRMRHQDGGWGWWEYDASSAEMTALVLDGLARAKAGGWNVSQAGAEKAVAWGLEALKSKKPHLMTVEERLYLIYSLSEWGASKAKSSLAVINLAKLSIAELATAALTFEAVGQHREAEKLLERLEAKAQRNSQVVSWDSGPDCWGDEVTSRALVAIQTIRPNDPLIPGIVRYLMNTRRGNSWLSTRDSAYALIGLTQFLTHSKELGGDASAIVTVDGKPVKSVRLDSHQVTDPNWTIQIPRASLGKAGVRIGLQKSGSGYCYYTVQLKTIDKSPELKPFTTDRGLEVIRHYYRLEPRALENGTTRLLPSLKPIDSFKTGDLIRVELDVISKVPRKYVLIEEPTPSSCRVAERDDPGEYEEWSWWWSRTITLDDHVAFFATALPSGVSHISYTMRAEQIGKVVALPTKVQNMYDPARTAYSGENQIEVSR